MDKKKQPNKGPAGYTDTPSPDPRATTPTGDGQEAVGRQEAAEPDVLEQLLESQRQITQALNCFREAIDHLCQENERRTEQISLMVERLREDQKRLPEAVARKMRPMVREELLRSRLVTADGPTEEQLLNMLQRALRPWLTQAPDQRQRMEHHFLPLLGEQKVWMDGDRVCVHCNYLQKFVDALFACMDAYHYDALRTRRVQTSTDLRVFLEHVVSYRQGNAERPLHIMTPIIRACRKMRSRRILDVRE